MSTTSLNNDFKAIGENVDTDKVMLHGYHRFYPQELQNIRYDKFGILEIGIQDGQSMNLWKQYLPNAFVYGLDIGVEYQDDRCKIFMADQGDIHALEQIKQLLDPAFPIKCINDDGSHLPEHQIMSFNYLFNEVLCDGGVYIIEDIETSYWKRGNVYGYPTNYGVLNKNSCIEKFKSLVDYVNRDYINNNDKQYINDLTSDFSYETKQAISSIRFAQNCIIIQKKNPEDYQYSDRIYGLPQFI
jgi:hypothetical protein